MVNELYRKENCLIYDDELHQIKLLDSVGKINELTVAFIGDSPDPKNWNEYRDFGIKYAEVNGTSGYTLYRGNVRTLSCSFYGKWCLYITLEDGTRFYSNIEAKKGGTGADGSSSGARKAIESLYKGRCKIIEIRKAVDPVTKRVTFTDVVTVENEPCRLSFSSVANAVQGNEVANVAQVVKLFIRPELTILAGSKIEVTQNGVTSKYVASGKPAVHTNHQEIVLTIEGDKA